MKLLIINGSSKEGNTSEVVKCFVNKLLKIEKYIIETIYLSDFKIDFCTGCHKCVFIGEENCDSYSNVYKIENKMLESDIIIFATPGYMFSVTGIMKNFLDHIAYNCHRPKYRGKGIFFIFCSASYQVRSILTPLRAFSSAAGFNNLGYININMPPHPLKYKEMLLKEKKIVRAVSKFHFKYKKNSSFSMDLKGHIVSLIINSVSSVFPRIYQADYNYYKKRRKLNNNIVSILTYKIRRQTNFVKYSCIQRFYRNKF